MARQLYRVYLYVVSIALLIFGLLVGAAYGLWLRAERVRLPLGAEGTVWTMEVIAAIMLAVPFWWGVGRVLDASFQWLGIGGAPVRIGPDQWAASLALLVTGLASIALAAQLLLRGANAGPPRRGYILALLAGGVVIGAAGLAVTRNEAAARIRDLTPARSRIPSVTTM